MTTRYDFQQPQTAPIMSGRHHQPYQTFPPATQVLSTVNSMSRPCPRVFPNPKINWDLNPRTTTLEVIQQPVHGAAVVDNKERGRKVLDPIPIVELKVKPQSDPDRMHIVSPNLLMTATLVEPDLRDNQPQPLETNHLIGTYSSSIHRIKDADNREVGYFVFSDISCRQTGKYRLLFSLYELRYDTPERECHFVQQVVSDIFEVVLLKNFKGQTESTALSRLINEQGVRLRLRKESRNAQMAGKKRAREPEYDDQQVVNNYQQMPQYGYSDMEQQHPSQRRRIEYDQHHYHHHHQIQQSQQWPLSSMTMSPHYPVSTLDGNAYSASFTGSLPAYANPIANPMLQYGSNPPEQHQAGNMHQMAPYTYSEQEQYAPQRRRANYSQHHPSQTWPVSSTTAPTHYASPHVDSVVYSGAPMTSGTLSPHYATSSNNIDDMAFSSVISDSQPAYSNPIDTSQHGVQQQNILQHYDSNPQYPPTSMGGTIGTSDYGTTYGVSEAATARLNRADIPRPFEEWLRRNDPPAPR